MTYIENIFLCMVSPLLVAALCMGRRQLRFFLFCIAGMGVCLLSAYINTFLAAVYQADALAATVEIAPVVEEVMKLLNDNVKALRGELGHQVAKQLRIVPEIVFYLDSSLDYAEHIDELLKK